MDNRVVIHYNKYSIALALIMFLNVDGFYMLSNFQISVNDISLIIEALFFIYIMFFLKGKYKYSYSKYIIVAIFFALTSSVMAHYSYSQPLWYGIRAQRHWICAILMYFPIAKLIKRGRLTKENLLGMLDFMNVIYVVLVTIQYFLGTNVRFMTVMSNERYGTVRLYVTLSFVLISYYSHLLRLIETKNKHGIDVFFVIATLFLNFAVTKSRMAIVALMIASALAVLSIRFTIKKLLLILLFFVALIAFFTSGIGQDTLAIVFDTGKSIGGDTSEIRELGRAFYLDSVLKSWKTLLFGCGFVNADWPQSVAGSGINLQYYYNDNGMFGLFFYYGGTFVVWAFAFYVRLLKDSWKNARMIFFLLVADLISGYSLIPLIYSTTINFALICAYLEKSNQDTEHSVQF